ncbi:MAG TPA: hypothetical protein VGF97_06270 [Rhizomicrobium sp.]|jgi:hypothetical protein
MVRRILACLAFGLALAGCADVNDYFFHNVADVEMGQVITGRYFNTRISGDLFEFPCRDNARICKAVLIRDNYLRFHSWELDGKKLVLRVQRTNACHDIHSTDFACHTSRDGTALLILQWIRPDV